MTDVFIIGDSISVGYTPHARAALSGRFALNHNAGNAGDSRKVLEQLEAFLAEAPPAEIIHFNCGLHDLRSDRPSGDCQVPLDAYRDNLRGIVDMLRARDAVLIWGRTTPIHDARHEATHADFDRRQADVDAYNAVADAIMAESGIAIDDLHEAVIAAGIDTCIRDDGVHMTEEGYAILGKHVAGVIARVASSRESH